MITPTFKKKKEKLSSAQSFIQHWRFFFFITCIWSWHSPAYTRELWPKTTLQLWPRLCLPADAATTPAPLQAAPSLPRLLRIPQVYLGTLWVRSSQQLSPWPGQLILSPVLCPISSSSDKTVGLLCLWRWSAWQQINLKLEEIARILRITQLLLLFGEKNFLKLPFKLMWVAYTYNKNIYIGFNLFNRY